MSVALLNSKRDESDKRDLLPHKSTRLCELVNNGDCREDNAVWAAFIRTFPLYRRRRMPPKEKMFLLSSQLALARVWVWTAHQPILAALVLHQMKTSRCYQFSSLAVMNLTGFPQTLSKRCLRPVFTRWACEKHSMVHVNPWI